MVTRYDIESDPQDGPCSLWPVEDEKGPYVTYEDYAALETRLLALLDHPVMKAHTEALREAQITGLAFIRVNANGHVQALPSDRVRISVIQAVEERTAAAAHQECDHLWSCGPTSGPMPEYVECVKCRSRAPLPEDGGQVWYQEDVDATPPAQCDHIWRPHLPFREYIRCGFIEGIDA